jgi:hypothetical protein
MSYPMNMSLIVVVVVVVVVVKMHEGINPYLMYLCMNNK